MSRYQLYIGNKNYSSWSLRPWILMQELGIELDEHVVPFSGGSNWDSFRDYSPSGKVPCLVDRDPADRNTAEGAITVWDSLAIAEYLAEKHPGVWPEDPRARAWARCVSAEMHSGFATLRTRCPMNCGLRVRLSEVPQELHRDVRRVDEIWSEGIERFGGPFLAGTSFSAADAMYAPVVFRFHTYGLDLSEVAAHYATMLIERPSMLSWFRDAIVEPWREIEHEEEIRALGTVLDDVRTASEDGA